MQSTSHIQPVVCSEFALHVTTDQVGLVVGVCTAGVETYKTIRLAEGKLLTSPAREFRSATDDEIKKRHRVAASIRLLDLPALSAVQSRGCSHLHRGRPAL